jgi:hypothetical protein
MESLIILAIFASIFQKTGEPCSIQMLLLVPFKTQLDLQKGFANLKICCIEDGQESLKNHQ